jgi:succinyl-CoA synthetase alpha subunit
LVSKSGTLTYEAADQVVRQGLGISTAIGIGGDPIIGTTTKEALELLMNDEETDAVVMIGEIGGQLESDAAHWYKNSGIKNPLSVLLLVRQPLRVEPWVMLVRL